MGVEKGRLGEILLQLRVAQFCETFFAKAF